MKKLFTFLVLAALVISLIACSFIEERESVQISWPESFFVGECCDEDMEITDIHVDWMAHSNIESKISETDIIFRGIVVNEYPEWIYRRTIVIDGYDDIVWYDLTTTTTFVVAEVFVGNIDIGDLIKINQHGGVYEAQCETIFHACLGQHRLVFPMNGDFIVFANSPSSLASESEQGLHFPWFPPQSFYWVASAETEESMSASSRASVVSEGVIVSHPDNPLILTRRDLTRLAEQNGISVGEEISEEIMEQVEEILSSR